VQTEIAAEPRQPDSVTILGDFLQQGGRAYQRLDAAAFLQVAAPGHSLKPQVSFTS
jgi:hypothetical protein